MGKLTKNQKLAAGKIEAGKSYSLKEAAQLVKDITFTKFDASLDIDVRLGVDPRKANQMVRGVVSLPHGTGKVTRVLVLCTPDAEAAVLGNRSPVVIDGVPCSGTSYRISRCGERAVRLGFRSQKINAILIREESDCQPAHNPQDHYNLQVSFYSTSLLYFRLWNGRIQNRRRCS